MSIATETTDFAALSDADLLDAWMADEHAAALATIIHRYSVMVLSVCRRRCRSEADAEDAFQTTFLYLARNCKNIRQPDRLSGWLHRVAQRAAVATLKAHQHETEPMVDTPANPEDPLDRLTQRHEAIVLDEELADLPEHYRSALVMHILDDQPFATMAEQFGTTIGSVRGRVQRGKKMLARRLRRRGVVPVLAFAAANAWTVSKPTAAAAGQTLIDATAGGDLPDSPIETSLLESLLNSGANLMPSLYTVTGIVGGAALLALALTVNGNSGGGDATAGDTVTIPAALGQFGGAAVTAEAAGNKNGNRRKNAKAKADQADDEDMEQIGMGGMGGRMAPPPDDPSSVLGVMKAKPTSALAQTALHAMDEEFDFQIPNGIEFIRLPLVISEIIQLPVITDDRALKFAEVEMEAEVHRLVQTQLPLRTALRLLLGPFGLKAEVENEGIVITADPTVLVHRGIGTSRWINVDNEAAELISQKLQEPSTFDLAELIPQKVKDPSPFEEVELPLKDAVQLIAGETDLAIVIDAVALEQIGFDGLTSDTLVSFPASKLKLQNALDLLLNPLDLTYTIRGESLMITSIEASDNYLLNRIYWLDGTGFAIGDYGSILNLIQSTIKPDSWDMSGGKSTMTSLTQTRPAIMVSASYSIHQSIEQLLKSLRESHFGADPISHNAGGQGGGGSMGGGGLGGGGFGGGQQGASVQGGMF